MEKGGSCELCSKAARMYCDSDEARLCWDCDEKVHSANFLVAKHSRSLLCHVCQSPTPWKASGTKLGPTVSICESCFGGENQATGMSTRRRELADESGDETESLDDQYSDSENDTDDCDEEEDENDEEDGENQVVPWSSTCPTPSSSAPPLATSSSSEHGSFSTRDGGAAVSSALKRSRDTRHLDSDEEEDVCCSSQVNMNAGATANGSRAAFRSLKMARAEEEEEEEEEELVHRQETDLEFRRRRMELLSSFMNSQQTTAAAEHPKASEVIRRISKLSRGAL